LCRDIWRKSRLPRETLAYDARSKAYLSRVVSTVAVRALNGEEPHSEVGTIEEKKNTHGLEERSGLSTGWLNRLGRFCPVWSKRLLGEASTGSSRHARSKKKRNSAGRLLDNRCSSHGAYTLAVRFGEVQGTRRSFRIPGDTARWLKQ